MAVYGRASDVPQCLKISMKDAEWCWTGDLARSHDTSAPESLPKQNRERAATREGHHSVQACCGDISSKP